MRAYRHFHGVQARAIAPRRAKEASIRYMTKPLMPWGKRSVGYSALALLRSSCRTGSTMIGDHQAGASQRADQPCFQPGSGRTWPYTKASQGERNTT